MRGWSQRRPVLPYRRPERPISVSAVPFGPSTDIWRSCKFIGALFFGHCVLCQVVLVGLCLAILVLVTAGFGTLDGISVATVSLPS